MRTTRAEMEETNPASTCRSKTVRTATAMPSTVGHRCFSTSVQRRGGCVCSILPALLPFAFVYTPWGYLYHGTLYPIRQGGDYSSDAIHEPSGRRVLGRWEAAYSISGGSDGGISMSSAARSSGLENMGQ